MANCASFKPRPALAFAIAAIMFIAWLATSGLQAQAPADAGKQEPGAGKGEAEGKGKGEAAKGRAPVPTLGDGPWEFNTELAKVRITVVSKGLDHPWGLALLPNGDMLVTERPGRLWLIRNGVLDPVPLGPLPAIRAQTLGGLLDIALHPNFAQNRLIYLSYSKPGPEGDPGYATTAVMRARYDGGTALSEVRDIYVADAWYGGRSGQITRCCGQGPPDGSYGSRLVFDREGFLYVTVGDRNYGEMAQNPSSDLGKIVRLRDDGTIPSDNPFVGKIGYNPQIWSLGHRNPLGLTLHPVTGEIWETEFGPRGGDELNRIRKGGNYGWIEATHGMHYNGEPSKQPQPDWIEPVLYWVPSINPGNLIFYYGDKFPNWRGNMLMATMTRSVLRASFDAEGKPLAQERMFESLGQRFRDVRSGPDGAIYLLTDETAGAVLKLEPAE